MSTSIRPPSPARPSSASVTTTTTSTSPPRSTALPSTTGSGSASGAGPATTPSSASSPPPTGPHPAALIAPPPQQQQHQNHHHQHHQPSGPRPPAPAPSSTHPHPRHPSHPLPSPTNPTTLPTPSQTAQIAQARDALVASLGNALDTELQTRAALLHGNQRAIEKQERDVGRALEDLRREDERLMKVLNEGSRKVKELGDVQNWAERLERDFLVVEETMRLVAAGGSGEESAGSWSGSESGSWSGSESGSEDGGGGGSGGGGDDDEGDVRMSDGDGAATAAVLDKGKQVAEASSDAMDIDPAPRPSGHDAAQDSASSSIVTAIKTPDQGTTASPLSSPGASSWLKRFIWRS